MILSGICTCGCFKKFENQEVDFIKEFDKWILYLHFRQLFFGRVLLILKRHETQFDGVSEKEIEEMLFVYRLWYRAVKKIAAPYTVDIVLSNTERDIHGGHLHFHFIPRFDRNILFDGESFPYENDNQKKSPYNLVGGRDIASIELRQKIRNAILKELKDD